MTKYELAKFVIEKAGKGQRSMDTEEGSAAGTPKIDWINVLFPVVRVRDFLVC